MAVTIRLQRHGKKGAPFYHIIATDKRSPRNGRFIERLGSYNPLTQPATIDIDVDKAVNWLQNGATASDTAHAILKYKGVVYKNHLLNGVKKGALKAEDVEAKFQTWMDGKAAKIGGHEDKIKKAKDAAKNAKFEAEKLVNETRMKANEEAAKLAEAEANKAAEEETAATDEVAALDTTAETTENPEA
jgi:small subunit ribosomal protein S16